MDDNKSEKKFILSDAVIVDFVFLAFFLMLAIVSFNYNPRARSIPLGLGLLGSVMMFLQLLADAVPNLRSKLRFIVQSGILATEKETNQKGLKEKERKSEVPPLSAKKSKSLDYWWHVLRITLCLVGFILLLRLFISWEIPSGYLIAVGAFITLITRFEAKESWKKSILLAVCINACFFILFDILLQAHL